MHGILHSEDIKCEHQHLQIHFIFSPAECLESDHRWQNSNLSPIKYRLFLLHLTSSAFCIRNPHSWLKILFNHIITYSTYIPQYCWYIALSNTLFLPLFWTFTNTVHKICNGTTVDPILHTQNVHNKDKTIGQVYL